MIVLKKDVDTLAKLKSIIELRNSKYDNAKYPDINIYIDDMTQAIICDALGESCIDKDNADDPTMKVFHSDYKDENAFTLKMYAQALTIGVLMGYMQTMNTDRKVKEEPDFGYSNLALILNSALEVFKSDVELQSVTDESVEAGLHIKLRKDVDAQTYFSNSDMYFADINFLLSIVEITKNAGFNETLLEAISKSGDIDLTTRLNDLQKVYSIVFADGFGINPYAGVLKDSTGFVKVSKSNFAQDIKENKTFVTKLAQRINKKLDGKIVFSKYRQFNYEEILENSGLVYYPYKILEYAQGKRSTLNLNTYTYLNEAQASSWDNYWNAYVKENVKDILSRGCYYILEKYSKEDYPEGMNSSAFINQYSTVEDCMEFIADKIIEMGDAPIDVTSASAVATSLFSSLIDKIIASMKCCYVLTRYNVLANRTTCISVRLTDSKELSLFAPTTTVMEELYKNIGMTNENEKFDEPFDLSSSETSQGKSLTVNIYEYRYDLNPLLTEAEPLFGYLIHKQNQKRGVKSSWNRILYGQSPTGKEIYSSKEDEPINMQFKLIHNIYAGSRAGKGVMTMNTLAAALADGKPVFYLDRKPDICAVMHEASNGKMFVINGGQQEIKGAKHEPFNASTFGGDAPATSMVGWKKISTYLSSTPDIASLFDSNITNYQVYGDLAYFRAFIFTLGLLALRTKIKSSKPELYAQMNGDKGLVIIIDELTNFESNFTTMFSNSNSPLFIAAVGTSKKGKTEEEISNEIKLKSMKLEEARNAKQPKQSTITQLVTEIEALKKELNTAKDIKTVYARTFYEKAYKSYKKCAELGRAGWKNEEEFRSDIFVLGQSLTPKYYDEADNSQGKLNEQTFFQRKSGSPNLLVSVEQADPVRSILEIIQSENWFLGGNMDANTPYGDTKGDGKKAFDYRTKLNWDYVGSNNCKVIRNNEPTEKHVMFKSYLVLNDTDLQGGTLYEPGGCAAQCKDTCIKNAGGENIWPSVVDKHTEDGVSLNAGVGFEGLVLEAMKTVYPSDSFESLREKLAQNYAKSGDIANIVAKCMGYDNWADLIFDFSPYGLFSVEDVVNAVVDPANFKVDKRLANFVKAGFSVPNIMAGEVADESATKSTLEDEYKGDTTDYSAFTFDDDTDTKKTTVNANDISVEKVPKTVADINADAEAQLEAQLNGDSELVSNHSSMLDEDGSSEMKTPMVDVEDSAIEAELFTMDDAKEFVISSMRKRGIADKIIQNILNDEGIMQQILDIMNED